MEPTQPDPTETAPYRSFLERETGMTRRSALAAAGAATAGGALLARALADPATAAAQGPEGGLDEVQPAPPSIGADVPLSYFGPRPLDPGLVGPLQLLRSGRLDLDKGTITLPLYEGRVRGRTIWYVLTDSSDAGNAEALGLLHSPKLAFGATGRGARIATLVPDRRRGEPILEFRSGTVNFRPERVLEPNREPNLFPPRRFEPGAVGDRDYTPLAVIQNAGGAVYNAPVVAYDVAARDLVMEEGRVNRARVHDKVVSINAPERVVELELIPGFSFAKPILYLSMDASDRLAAAMEGVTFAPALSDIQVGGDDSAFSAVERIFAVINGPRGRDNPQRQGFNSALAGEGRGPLNMTGGIPTVANDYSPLWDLNLAQWTDRAIERGYRSRLIEEFQLLGLVQEGHLTGPGGARFGSTGIIINCPVAHRFL